MTGEPGVRPESLAERLRELFTKYARWRGNTCACSMCAKCREFADELETLVREDAARVSREAWCMSCHHRWTLDDSESSGATYCGDCHRAAIKALDDASVSAQSDRVALEQALLAAWLAYDTARRKSQRIPVWDGRPVADELADAVRQYLDAVRAGRPEADRGADAWTSE
jgi:bacterioferritin-associated ferredoxin